MKHYLGSVVGATLALFVRAFVTTTAVILVIYLVVDPKMVGTWQAQVEECFFEEAERIGLWEEETY
jgi:hypothetical protein